MSGLHGYLKNKDILLIFSILIDPWLNSILIFFIKILNTEKCFIFIIYKDSNEGSSVDSVCCTEVLLIMTTHIFFNTI